jgi:site-specific DNA recombinase
MRAVGIIRVSKVAGREGASFASPAVQRERIETICKTNGWELAEVLEELDVSGGKSLAKRPGLSKALQLVEARKAEIVVAAYFDRLFRSLSTQSEVVDRVERAGGQVYAVDMGGVSNATAGQWLTGTLIGAISEYYRRQTGEKLREAAVRAAKRGVYAGKIPLGYLKGADGRLEVDPKLGPVVSDLFARRAEGASLRELCEALREHGVERWPGPMSKMLQSRIYLGQVTYGDTVATDAHPALVTPELWRRAQLQQGRAGRKPATVRLLNCTGVLRCSGCGRPLALASSNGMGAAPRYRCASAGSRSFCPSPVTINAEVAEEAVASATRAQVAGIKGRGNAAADGEAKHAAFRAAQEALDGTLATFQASGLIAEPGAVDRLSELRRLRDEAQAEVDRHSDAADVVISADVDWHRLTVDEQRALVRAVISSVTVLPNSSKWRTDGQDKRVEIEFRA